jgi:hypothetical protein
VNPVYSNQGYNSFQGPGYLAVDSALHKKFLLPWFGSEQSTLTLGIEGTHVINRAKSYGPRIGRPEHRQHLWTRRVARR